MAITLLPGKMAWGGNDIYTIEMTPKDRKPITTAASQPAKKAAVYFMGKVTDASTGEVIFAELVLSDNRKNIVIDRQFSDASTGEFKIAIPEGDNFGLTIEADGYLFFSQNFDAAKLKGKTERQRQDLFLLQS